MKSFFALSIAALAAASPCPYGQLAERGALPEADAANFYAARAEGESAVKEMMHKREAEVHAEQEKFYKRQVALGDLPLGGGLLAGALQPFSGILSKLDVPTYDLLTLVFKDFC